MFSQLSSELGLITDNDSTGDYFNSISSLLQFDVVVFSNTTGDAILDSNQRINFENYIAQGGNVIGIHSATDTYRHSSANGSNTGVWDFYAEMLGASVQQNPTHVNGLPVYEMSQVQSHPLLNGIPDPWVKAEEYYYWENGYFDSTGNNILLTVEATVGPNGSMNSYDSSRATAWFRVLPSGSKIFYTSLGHDVSNYTSDSLFYKLTRNALLWMQGVTALEQATSDNNFTISNPINNFLYLSSTKSSTVGIYDITGRLLLKKFAGAGNYTFDISDWSRGMYFFKIMIDNKITVKKLLKN
jgi:uncharacterized protein